MRKNKSALPEANPKGLKICADRGNDQARRQYTTPVNNPQSLDAKAYGLAVRRACGNAFALLKGFPTKKCYSYYVDRNGRLRSVSDGRTET